jgi:Cellulase (glycosyl hydrolase family 5)
MKALIAIIILASCLIPLRTTGSAGAKISAVADKWDLWRGPTCLRGANIWQKRVTADDGMGGGAVGPPYSQQDFNNLAAWGANYVNISHPGIFTEKPDYRIEEAVYQNLVNLIDMAERAGLFVVVAYRTGPGRNEAVFGGEAGKPLTKVWKKIAAQDGWVAMWRETARRLKDRSAVVGYDLMVEPETQKHGTWNRLAKRITQAIREVDPLTPILLGAADWSTVDSLDEIERSEDDRTVYTIHQYEPYDYSHQETRGSAYSREEVEEIYRRISDFKNKYGAPVAINEFGVARHAPDASGFIALQMELIERMGANHALWLWETSFPLDYDEFNFRHGPIRSNHTDVQTSELIETIKSNWSKNQVLFSN